MGRSFIEVDRLVNDKKHGSRRQRRAIESDALKEARRAGTGLSIPALKALIRRKNQERGNK